MFAKRQQFYYASGMEMRGVPRKILVLVTLAVVLVAGGVFLTRTVKSRNRTILVPGNFLNARFDAALVSRRIVELTTETNNKIKAINLSDLAGNAAEARNLIKGAKENNTDAYQRAFELSHYLQRLAESLAELNSNQSQRLAYEAVAVELSLVSEFIVYTKNLNDFLDDLDRAVTSNTSGARDGIYRSLRAVNKSTEKINKLNNDFLAKMKKFDGSL